MKKEKKWMNMRSFGFTLVELIVVLVILSITAAVAVPAVTGYIDDSKTKECQSQREALASEIATARMSYEIDGTDEDGKELFDVQGYIDNKAGDLGHCPSGDPYTYDSVNNSIICTHAKHGNTPLAASGTISVASVDVKENLDERESEPEFQSESEKKHSYTVEISPGSLKDMKPGDPATALSVTVKDETGKEVSGDKIKKVEWTFPNEIVDYEEAETSASVTAKKAGEGSITCTVTIEDENGTQTSTDSVDVTVIVPELHLAVTGPGSLKVDEEGNLKLDVTDENGEPYLKEGLEFSFTSSDPNVATVDGEGKIHAVAPGSCQVTVTVKDPRTGATDTQIVDVTVENEKPKPHLEVPTEVQVEAGEHANIDVSVKDENGNSYTEDDVIVTYESNNSDVVSVDPNTGEVSGVGTPGEEAEVTVTLKDRATGEVLDKKTVTVKVSESEPENPDDKVVVAEDGSSFSIGDKQFRAGSWEMLRVEMVGYGNQNYYNMDGQLRMYTEKGEDGKLHLFVVVGPGLNFSGMDGTERVSKYNGMFEYKPGGLIEVDLDNVCDYDKITDKSQTVPPGTILLYQGNYYILTNTSDTNLYTGFDNGKIQEYCWWPLWSQPKVPEVRRQFGETLLPTINSEDVSALPSDEKLWLEFGNIIQDGDDVYVCTESHKVQGGSSLDYSNKFLKATDPNNVKKFENKPGTDVDVTSPVPAGTIVEYTDQYGTTRQYISTGRGTYSTLMYQKDGWILLR